MLSLISLSLRTHNQRLFRDISISFLPSSIVYLKGPNGSGKTSLLKIVAGLQKPTSGCVKFGRYNTEIADLRKPHCLYIGHELGIKNELTVFENIKFWSKIYNSFAAMEAAIRYFNLEESLDMKGYELSAGNKKKLALTRLMVCHSNLWLLDEIYTNLDKENSDFLTRLIITKADSGGIVFITTNQEPEIKSALTLSLTDYL